MNIVSNLLMLALTRSLVRAYASPDACSRAPMSWVRRPDANAELGNVGPITHL